jgi:glycerol-3-phosphate cytidylyltransferase
MQFIIWTTYHGQPIMINHAGNHAEWNTGFTCGTFDLLHAGHVSMFREVKGLCKHLIVGIQIDPSVDRPEKNKPVQSLIERQIQVNACRYVDETIVYATEEDLLVILKTLPIHVRFVGSEYEGKEFTGKSLPIPIVYNNRDHHFSSSELRQRVAKTKTE